MLHSRIFNRISCVLTTCILLVVTTFSASATSSSSPSEAQIDAALQERGYPQILLEHTTLPAKQSLYNQSELIFASGSIAVYDQQKDIVEEYNVPADGTSTIGQIPTKDLTLSFIVSRMPAESSYNVEYSYEWLNPPVNRYEDPIAVTWDEDIFAIEDDSFIKEDFYETIYGKEGTTSSEERYARASSSGVTWYADLKSGEMNSLYGYAAFVLNQVSSGSGSSRIYGNYVHSKSTASISLTPIYGGIIINPPDEEGYDEAGNQTTVKYH